MIFFYGLDDDPFLVVVFCRFDPPCMVEELDGSDFLGSDKKDSGKVIIREG